MKFTIKKSDSKKADKTKTIKVQKTMSKLYNDDNIYTKVYKKAGKAIYGLAGKFCKKKS